jgi:hypothetical protein
MGDARLVGGVRLTCPGSQALAEFDGERLRVRCRYHRCDKYPASHPRHYHVFDMTEWPPVLVANEYETRSGQDRIREEVNGDAERLWQPDLRG